QPATAYYNYYVVLQRHVVAPIDGRSLLIFSLMQYHCRREQVISEERLYMELLAAEYSDEEPNAGAQEGSGDDYDD
ncbi:hypothetical protein B0H13DRAFT_902845, partial [Mycena leptocephala]